MAKDNGASPPPRVGVIGAGQLARMMAESASELGIQLVVLAASENDGAVASAADFAIGEPLDVDAVTAFGAKFDVLTIDHELVSLDALRTLENQGVSVYPSSTAIQFAARKDHQRRVMHAAGVPVPQFHIMERWSETDFDAILDELGDVIAKAAVGGYDGRAVLTGTPEELAAATREWLERGPVILEQRVSILHEVAALVVTAPNGERQWWPLVRTVQQDGMCVEVNYPAPVDHAIDIEANRVAALVADVVGAVGVLAIELFVTPEGVLLNEVATRPHNSGHWTIEGSVTSQFENHLRAVLGWPLGSTTPTAHSATMVNVIGSNAPGSRVEALKVEGAHVHDYGKAWRPGRKLGHVTAIGAECDEVRVRAWDAARALATAARKESW